MVITDNDQNWTWICLGKIFVILFLRTVELISVKLIFNSKYKFMHVAMVSKSLTEERI